MSSTFGIFESAKSGLSVSMQQLNVTEQNIANVNTEGYTRQRILTSAKEPSSSVYLVAQLNKTLVGQGVEATGIQQIRSSYLDQQYRNLNSNYNYSSSRDQSLAYLKGVLNELDDDSSVTTAISKFASALNDFTKDTSSQSNRTNVQQQALSMTQSFNNVYEEMQSLWNDQNDSINNVVQNINSIAQKISQLNDSIAGAVQTGGTANDLSDERNLLLDQLSGYVNITYGVSASNDSMVDVKIGGLMLVDGKTANKIEVDNASQYTPQIQTLTSQITTINKQIADGTVTALAGQTAIAPLLSQLGSYINVTSHQNASNNNLTDIDYNGVALVKGVTTDDLTIQIATDRNNLTLNGNELSLENKTVTSGQLYGDMELIANQSASSPGIPYYMAQLNSYVRTMAENLNTINRSGYTYPDDTNLSVKNVNFFNNIPSYTDPVSGDTVYDYSKVTAGNFTLSDEVMKSANNIAGSSVMINLNVDSNQSGNNEVALELLKDLTTNGYNDRLNSIVANLAIAANTNTSIMSTKHSLLSSVDTQRKSTSAVSLDEETTNLIIFQQSYNAAARIISTLDEMLNTMINNMGAR